MSTARFDTPAPLLPLPLIVSRHPRARVLRLRFDARAGVLRLTCPPRVSRRAALQWAGEQKAWVEAQLAARPPSRPFAPGSAIPFRGGELLLEWQPAAPRAPQQQGDRLLVGGPAEGFARRVEGWLRQQARQLLGEETAAVARRAGVRVTGVAVGDPATRWGSCSSSGAIRYSWRLVLAPPEVLRSVVAHEVAHRLHMDHGPSFRAAEGRLYDGDLVRARLLLRRLGRSLHLVGRGN